MTVHIDPLSSVEGCVSAAAVCASGAVRFCFSGAAVCVSGAVRSVSAVPSGFVSVRSFSDGPIFLSAAILSSLVTPVSAYFRPVFKVFSIDTINQYPCQYKKDKTENPGKAAQP